MKNEKFRTRLLILFTVLLLGFLYLFETENADTLPAAETEITPEASETKSPAETGEAAVKSIPLKESSPEAEAEKDISEWRVNINTADKEMLKTLPYIGDARAEAILAYRNRNGPFENTEEIMNVKGIGQGIYERIRDKIRVRD